MSFSASSAALEGFRVIGRRPWAVVLWTVAMLAFTVALIALFLAVSWPALAEFGQRKHEVLVPSDLIGLIKPLGAGVAAVLPLALIMNGVLLAALFRAVLQPENGGLGYLRLGADELRQVVVCLLQMLLQFVFLGGFVALGLAVWTRIKDGAAAPDAAGVLMLLVGVPVLLVLGLWFGVRLSLAGAMTQASGRVRFLESWTLTRGRFWPLLGMYLLAYVLGMVLYFIGSMLVDAVVALAGGLGSFHADDLQELAQLPPAMGAGLAVFFLLQMLLATLHFAVLYAPQAAAVRDLGEEGAA